MAAPQLDMYSLCPCGSGKKLKFCCQPLSTEMEKVEKLPGFKTYEDVLPKQDAA